jgi:hypothetical protein
MAYERIRISGSLSQMTKLRETLLANPIADVKVEPIAEAHNDPLNPQPLGMEPQVYFFVAFAAHLTAAVVHDYVNKWRTSGGAAAGHKQGSESSEPRAAPGPSPKAGPGS